jgi:hypothetical protein
MNDFDSILQQLRSLTEAYVPSGALTASGWWALLTLGLGVIVCVLGAKLARGAITACFVAIGGMLGVAFASLVDLPALPCTIVAGAVVGVVAFMTYRLWAGVLTALVVSSIVMTVFGYQRVVPHLAAFEPAPMLAAQTPSPKVADAPEPSDVRTAVARAAAAEWIHEFRSFLAQQDSRIGRHAEAVALGSGLIGLFIGVVLVRFALIGATAILGTSMITGSLLSLCQTAAPAAYQTLAGRPAILGMGVGAIFVGSVVLQFIMTRRPRPESPPPKAKPVSA